MTTTGDHEQTRQAARSRVGSSRSGIDYRTVANGAPFNLIANCVGPRVAETSLVGQVPGNVRRSDASDSSPRRRNESEIR